MTLQVLVSTMHQTNFNLVEKMNIKSDAIIINQCDHNSLDIYDSPDKDIKMYSTTQRGLSKSRNLALANAKADICLIADDDIVYNDDYENIIIKAFKELPQADVIVFNTTMLNSTNGIKQNDFLKIRKSPIFKNYASVRIAFRLNSFLKSNVWFHSFFGTGSIYNSGEESLVIINLKKMKVKIFEYPANISKVDCSTSTWFNGYDDKFFFDKGAFLSAAYPKLKKIFKYYYYFRFKNHTKITGRNVLKLINDGIKGYKYIMSYNDYAILNVEIKKNKANIEKL